MPERILDKEPYKVALVGIDKKLFSDSFLSEFPVSFLAEVSASDTHIHYPLWVEKSKDKHQYSIAFDSGTAYPFGRITINCKVSVPPTDDEEAVLLRHLIRLFEDVGYIGLDEQDLQIILDGGSFAVETAAFSVESCEREAKTWAEHCRHKAGTGRLMAVGEFDRPERYYRVVDVLRRNDTDHDWVFGLFPSEAEQMYVSFWHEVEQLKRR